MRVAICAVALLALPGIAVAETHTVVIEGMKFQPESLIVKRGDKVVWRNKDVVPHTATATAAGSFDSRNIGGSSSWSWTASAKGRHDYVCIYHPGMKGTVVVE